MDKSLLNTAVAGDLRMAYLEYGDAKGWPAVLLHGFPYDVNAYNDVGAVLATAGARVIVPYLRGFGPTRFVSANTRRAGQQAALACDVVSLLDALRVEKALLAGYDWGGRAACIVAALWPERVGGLVSGNGYTIQNIAASGKPAPPEQEYRFWYQYYFHGDRGYAGLERNREAICPHLWQLWSPNWTFSEGEFARTAESFWNPDFVDVVTHSYRHRFGLVDGDPKHSAIEARLASLPRISVPSITIDGCQDGVTPAREAGCHAIYFTGPHEHKLFDGAGHNLPQECPEAFAHLPNGPPARSQSARLALVNQTSRAWRSLISH
jgi:pimeloyl-ACP methyl ester carboxylesterase